MHRGSRLLCLFFICAASSCIPDNAAHQPQNDTSANIALRVDTFNVHKPDTSSAAIRNPGFSVKNDSLHPGDTAKYSIVKTQNISGHDSLPGNSWADVPPSFPGGGDAMDDYIHKKVVYPLVAFQNDVKGTVFLNVVIQNDGKIGNVKVDRGIGYGCDEEAVKVVRGMPQWIPAKRNGVNVAVMVNIPVSFGY